MPSLLVAILCSCLLHGVIFFVLDRLLRQSFVASGPYPHSGVMASLGWHPVKGKASSIRIANVPENLPPAEVAGMAAGRADAAIDRSEAGVSVTEDVADDKVFVQSSLLTVRPKALTEVDIDESPLSEDKAVGRVVLILWVSKSGEVVSVDVESSDYAEPTTAVIRDGFRRLRFSPGLVGGTPVNSTMKIEVTYDYAFDR